MDRRIFGRWMRPHQPRSGEIVYWFRPNTTPTGGAPIEIRQCWVGVPLPVRRPRPIEDGIAVDPRDAIKALEHFGHHAAGLWWRELLQRRPATESFVFRRDEGELLPPRLALMLHPDLDGF
jgi:hypothetical protein